MRIRVEAVVNVGTWRRGDVIEVEDSPAIRTMVDDGHLHVTEIIKPRRGRGESTSKRDRRRKGGTTADPKTHHEGHSEGALPGEYPDPGGHGETTGRELHESDDASEPGDR